MGLAESFYNGDWSQAINNAIRYAYDNKYNKVILPSGELLISTLRAGDYLYWVYIEGAWVGFDKIDI